MNGISLGTWLCPCDSDRIPRILSTSLFAFSPKDLYRVCWWVSERQQLTVASITAFMLLAAQMCHHNQY